MAETKQTNKNLIIISGALTQLQHGKTTQGFPFANVEIESVGIKYTDLIPCVAYGEMAKRLEQTAKVGDQLIVYGRVRSKVKTTLEKTQSYLSVVITSVKKLI